MTGLLLDSRYALRVPRKSPAFTLVAVLTLMLGIGANAVVFGVLNAVLLHPLAVSDPPSLYQLRHKPWMSGRLLTHSYPTFEDFRQRNTTFSGMAAVYGYPHASLRSGNAIMNGSGDAVTGNYFDLLGVQPEAGRFFHASDERNNGRPNAPFFVEMRIRARTVGPGVHPNRQQAGEIRVCLRKGDSRFQASHAAITEPSQPERSAVKRGRQNQVKIRIDQPEPARHHSHDLARLPIYFDIAPDRGPVARKAPLPISITEHYSFGPFAN